MTVTKESQSLTEQMRMLWEWFIETRGCTEGRDFFPEKNIIVSFAKLCPEKDKWNKTRKKVNAEKEDKNGQND